MPSDDTVTIDTTNKRTSVSRVIPAEPSAIFAVLVDPSLHAVIDGSSTVQASKEVAPERLTMGSTFGMKMKKGLPYTIGNTVVEFETDRLIAWQHLGRHRWRYELEPVEGGTLVTESFDWSTSPIGPLLELGRYPQRHVAPMQRTLANLSDFLVNRSESL